ncbi:MAG TPA: undecaprenyl-diphosphate phosphatase [Parvibaculum sp.]|uniref:undecaprenyl-diphosphate phosphatase n=1 Tax=Parvibaculum sp. TaxID=2024848 RepID=UPI002D1B7CE4|nr:undecaprenyl-diphosphate phosphatase [Parvibaculum sp.]HMM14405.1 undecaprenyl-diphosphate phosphatase [Parvibaculum sp.]
MSEQIFLQAIILGIVEGVTEFLPVSSTGHLIVAGEFLGFSGPLATVFDVVIQLGAILAICVLYARKLFGVAFGLVDDPAARNFAIAILIAFLPAAVLGFLLHDFIKQVLFSPLVVCASLILGGFAILAIERWRPEPRIGAIESLTPLTSLKIGLFQCLAMIPGVSRSGATILGALTLGVDRKTAAEFSFFLAIPTMFGATALDLWKNRHILNPDDSAVIALGFVAAFLSAIVVVRWLVNFVSRHSFAVFGWYRILFGAVLAVHFIWLA